MDHADTFREHEFECMLSNFICEAISKRVRSVSFKSPVKVSSVFELTERLVGFLKVVPIEIVFECFSKLIYNRLLSFYLGEHGVNIDSRVVSC